MDGDTGLALKEEMGVDAALITSLELYNESAPPRISLTLRLVSTGSDLRILWIDGRGLSGDDSRGILGLGIINDPRRLMEKAVHSLLDSLFGAGEEGEAPVKRFRPLVMYRSSVFSPALKYRVAVIPFNDLSGTRNAGEVMGLQFVCAMAPFRNFEVIEPGVVRAKMLRYRIVLDQGVSLAQADILFDALQADLILSGTVFRYEDSQGALGAPRVEFSAQLIEKKSREVVWYSFSNNAGDDGVFFFDAGRVSTVQALAMRMARLTVESIVQE
jgi:TolB-like protein